MMGRMEHPHLEQRQEERRGRRKRILIGFSVILVLTVVIIAVVWRQAGVWGVPGFTFRHELGSHCTNTFTGYECEMTPEHVRAVTETEFPPEAELGTATYIENGGLWSMTARFVLPENTADDALAQLKETFGDCTQHAPSSLRSEPGLTDFCVLTSDRSDSEMAKEKKWTIASARNETGEMVLQVDMSEV